MIAFDILCDSFIYFIDNYFSYLQALSRAFRNRFIEMHFDEIPRKELEEILHRRCHLPESYSKKFVKVMHDLQVCVLECLYYSGGGCTKLLLPKILFLFIRDV